MPEFTPINPVVRHMADVWDIGTEHINKLVNEAISLSSNRVCNYWLNSSIWQELGLEQETKLLPVPMDFKYWKGGKWKIGMHAYDNRSAKDKSKTASDYSKGPRQSEKST